MAGVIKKKKQKKRGKSKKKPETFSAPTLFKGSYVGFASLLILLFPLFKAGVKFRGRNSGLEGVGDHSPTQPRGQVGVPGKGADKAMELLRMHPKYRFRSKPELAEGSAVFGNSLGEGRRYQGIRISRGATWKPQHALGRPRWSFHS